MTRRTKTNERASRLVIASLAMVAIAGCQDDEETASANGLTNERAGDSASVIDPTPAGADDYADVSDDEIEAAVVQQLWHDGSIPPEVEVESHYGVVTLRGTVDTLIARERATRATEVVLGVKVVDNDLDVKTDAVPDAELVREVQRALVSDPAADSYEIEVSARDGRVTLEGTVQSHTEWRHAERVAKGVRGVTSVDNDLVIDYDAHRLDSEILRDVEQRLRWDALVGHHLIDVEVEDGTVVLSGTVGSAAERRRAMSDAWVLGAEEVDAYGLDVEPWAKREHLRDTKHPIIDDEEIKSAILMAAIYEPYLLSFQLEPEVDNGVVTLRGTVDNAKAKAIAEEIAHNTIGVISVINRITIDSDQDATDDELEERIEQGLLRNAITESFEIDVEVDQGRATLTGTVDNFAELAEASDVALSVLGVWSVDNQLEVQSPVPFVHDPYLSPYHPYGIPWGWYGTIVGAPTSDAAIAERIRDELFWSPFVDEDDVVVTVNDGTATLTGTVSSWQEYRSASENAFEGGARVVDNDLIVRREP